MESLPNPAPARLPSSLSIFPRAINHRYHTSLSGHKIGGQRLLSLLKVAIEGKIDSETPRVITLWVRTGRWGRRTLRTLKEKR